MKAYRTRGRIGGLSSAALLAAAAMAVCAPARADEFAGFANWGPTFRSVYRLDSWRQDATGISGARLTQGGTSVEATAPVFSWLHLDVASGYLATDQHDVRVVGFEDTRLAVSIRPIANLLLRAGTSFPTGEAKLDTTDLTLARSISDRLHSYRTSPLGEGYNYEFAAVGAWDAGPGVVGLGVGYLLKREYRFLDDAPKYDPANQLSVSGGVDFRIGQNFWRLDSGYYGYSNDRLDGEKVYHLGRRLVFGTTFRRPVGPTEVQLRGAVVLQAKSKTFESSAPADTLAQTDVNTTISRAERAGEYYVSGRCSGKIGQFQLAGSIGARWIGANLVGVGDGWRLDLIPELTYTLSERLHLATVASFRSSWGRIDARANETIDAPDRTDLKGFGLEAGLQIGGQP